MVDFLLRSPFLELLRSVDRELYPVLRWGVVNMDARGVSQQVLARSACPVIGNEL